MTRKPTATSSRKTKPLQSPSQVAEPLLRTKLFVPSLKRIVARPRLVARIESGLRQQPLILVSAPPGYGKTTLVADALAHTGMSCAWLSLDERDNDPVRFSGLLIAALRTVTSDIGQAAQSLLTLPQLPAPEGVATCLINDLTAMIPGPRAGRLESEAGLALVFDDYHTISHSFIHSLVEFLVENAPPLLHVVVVTRQDPPFALSRLRVRGQMTEIRADDLRFTRDEAEEWFNRHLGLSLGEAAVTVLQTRTEGWIAGLHLAGVSLQGCDAGQASRFVDDFGGSDRYIMDYLLDEVLYRQTAEMRSFLLQTAILDRFNASLCDAVTQRTDSKALLNRLERMNLFLIPLDRHREWYRYHHLFADFLRTALETTEQDKLHRRAAEWYSPNGFQAEAIEHALMATDFEMAAEWIQQTGIELVDRGEFATLLRWIAALPDPLVRRNANLSGLQGLALFLTEGAQSAERIVDAAEPSANADTAGKGRLLTVRAMIKMRREAYAECAELARRALELVPDSDPVIRILALQQLAEAERLTGHSEQAIRLLRQALEVADRQNRRTAALLALNGLVPYLNRMGQRREALALCRGVLERYADPSGQPVPLANLVQIPLGMLEYAGNELDAAYEHVRQGLAFDRQVEPNRAAVGDGEWTMVQILYARGEAEAALELAHACHRVSLNVNHPRMIALMGSILADVQLKMGDQTAAGYWAEEAERVLPVPVNASLEVAYFVLVRIWLAQGRVEQAQLLLGELAESARQDGRKARLITILVLQALAHHALGNHDMALEQLRSAVEIAAPEGYVRPLLDEGPTVQELLPQVRDRAPAFVDRLLADFGSATAQPLPSAGSTRGDNPKSQIPNLSEPLSEREIEVLRLLVDGRSNAEIAQALVITPGTAKWHVHNLLGKLGVENRAQAIGRARELNLL